MATFNIDGTDTTVSFDYTAPTAKIQEVIGACAEYLWQEETDEEGNAIRPFAEATNAEKLAVVDTHVKRVLLDMANTHKSIRAQELARETEAQSEYVI